jgi:hypothetical protein
MESSRKTSVYWAVNVWIKYLFMHWARYLSLSITDILGWIIRHYGNFPVYYSMFTCMSYLHWLDTSHTLPMVSTKMTPDIANCPLRGKINPLRTSTLDWAPQG